MITIAMRKTGEFREDQPLDDMYYLDACLDLAATLGERARLFIVKSEYLGGATFSQGWLCDGRARRAEKVKSPIVADLIFSNDIGFVPDAGAPMVNRKSFDLLCNDKQLTARLFPDLCPQTAVARSAAELEDALKRIPGDTVVAKPIDGFGGEGVFIGDRHAVATEVSAYPCLVQQFIDTSAGIPGVVDTYHDLRLIVVNGAVAFSFTRTPRGGSLVSNFSRGGMMMPVPAMLRPPEAMAMCERIDRELRCFGSRNYAVDCGRDRSGKWYLIELNAPPAPQSRVECGDEADAYLEMCAAFLLGAAEERRKEAMT